MRNTILWTISSDVMTHVLYCVHACMVPWPQCDSHAYGGHASMRRVVWLAFFFFDP